MSFALLNLARVPCHRVGERSVSESVKLGLVGNFSRASSAFASAGNATTQILPIIIYDFFVQKYIVSGLTPGSVK